MSGPGQLDPKMEAAFMRLVERTQVAGVRDTLLLNKTKLVENEVVSEEALQALTQKDLEEYGLKKAAAGALKLAFPTPTTAGAGGAAGGSGLAGDVDVLVGLIVERLALTLNDTLSKQTQVLTEKLDAQRKVVRLSPPGPQEQGGASGPGGSEATPQQAGAGGRLVSYEPDEGVSEAAAEHAFVQCCVAALRQGLDLKDDERLVFTPPTFEEYAESFQFNFHHATSKTHHETA